MFSTAPFVGTIPVGIMLTGGANQGANGLVTIEDVFINQFARGITNNINEAGGTFTSQWSNIFVNRCGFANNGNNFSVFAGSKFQVRLCPGVTPIGSIANPYDNTANIIGFLGLAANPLTSAKVYTCQFSPLDLYLSGGTVSAMTKNGVAIPYFATVTNYVHLEPGDTWSITFTVTPTTASVQGW
jgi:hypothetical protein